MSKKLQLQIPEPCHEKWDKMTPVEQGRFCGSCQKSVIDFTGMSDAQLVAFFKKQSTGSICGRFFNDQLDRDFEIPRKRIPWLKYFFQFTIPVFLTTLKGQAQGNISVKERNTPTICNDAPKALSGTVGMIATPYISKKVIGIVTDENGSGIPYASVYIKGTKQGTMCDSSGVFQLVTEVFEKKITLAASCVGYLPVEKQLNIKKDNSIAIPLTMAPSENGEVVVTSLSYTRGKVALGGYTTVVVKRTTFLQKVKDCFVSDSIKVFPNPAKAGSEIQIGWKNKQAGEYNISLFNLQGQLIQSSLVNFISETNTTGFSIPAIVPGNYILRLINKKSGKKYSEKITIQ